jgi:dihydrolipoamide dehydrogenase
MTEAEAREAGRNVKVASFPWGASGRATTLGRSDGVTRLIVDPADHNRLLGVGMAGPGAGELIAEGTLAIEMGAVADDLAWTIHPHPTLSETVMEAAESAGGHAIHYAR